MTVADFITRQKGRKQVVFAPMGQAVLVPERRPAARPDGLVRSRALLKAAEIVLIHFPGEQEWTLADDNRTVVLDDETTFSIYDY